MNTTNETSNGSLNHLGYEQSFKRVLTLRSLVLFGLSYMAPICVFTSYGVITSITHGMMAMAYVIALCAILLTAMSYAKMANAYPVSGSAYSYVQRSINPHIGFLTGWAMLLDYILLPMLSILFLGLFMNQYCPAIPTWGWIIISIVIIALINIFGIEPTDKVNTVAVIFQVAYALLFLILIAKLVAGGGGAGTLITVRPFYNADEFTMNGMLIAVGIVAVSFLGFDAVTTLAEETINPEKTVSRAIILVCLLAGLVFTLESYACQIGWPNGWKVMADPNVGFFELTKNINADYMQTAYFWIGNLASLTCALSCQAAVSRILFGMGRDGALPKKFFGYVHPKFKTPVCNILLVSVISLSAIFFSSRLVNALSLISFGALLGFVLVNLSVVFHYFIKGKKRSNGDIVKYLILPLMGFAICGYLIFNIANQAKILGLIWLAVGIVYAAATTNLFRKLPPELKLE